MHTTTTLAILSPFLLTLTNAQNTTTSNCSAIESAVQYNSSTTRSIQPYFIAGQKSDRGTFRLVNDSQTEWELSLRVQKMPPENNTAAPRATSPNYQQTMFLDTGNSNMTHIGACHHTIQAAINGIGYEWTKDVMQKSLEDSGDCSVLLGQECIQALRTKFRDQASQWPLRTGDCRGMNTTMPEECAGSGLGPQLLRRQMNTTYFNNETAGNLNANFPPDLECNGINASATHSVPVAERMAYEDAVRFPVVDVISFFPNRSSGLGLYINGWENDVQIEIVCMKADREIREGSEVPPTGAELLEREGAKFPTASGAGKVVEMTAWMGLVAAGVMVVL